MTRNLDQVKLDVERWGKEEEVTQETRILKTQVNNL
jgi:hypothetical protein